MAHERIELNPEVMGGKPVIRGTRVPVEVVLRKLGAGMTVEAVVADHPRLTADDIRQRKLSLPIISLTRLGLWPIEAVRCFADECVDASLVGYLRRGRA